MTVLDTPRLRLLPLAERHIPAYQAFIASSRAEALGWGGMPHEAWRNFAAMLGHGLLRGFAPFALEARDTGRALGLCGPWWPEGQKEREVKWHIWAAEDEGKGYAHEAARAALAHVFGTLGWETAVSYITAGNARSQALARRLGATQDGTWTTPRGTEVLVYRHKAPLPSSPTRGEARPDGRPEAPVSGFLAHSPSWEGAGEGGAPEQGEASSPGGMA